MTRDELVASLTTQLFDYGQRADQNTDDLAAILAPFLAAWDASAPYKIPGPYEIAMTYGAALAASGKVDSLPAAMIQAWAAVPEFYKARDWYLNEFAPMRMGVAMSPPEGETNDNGDAG